MNGLKLLVCFLLYIIILFINSILLFLNLLFIYYFNSYYIFFSFLFCFNIFCFSQNLFMYRNYYFITSNRFLFYLFISILCFIFHFINFFYFHFHSHYLSIPIEFPDTPRTARFGQLVELLPPTNKAILDKLIEFLVKVDLHSAINKMDAANLATMFGPNLLRSEDDSMEKMLRDTPHVASAIQALILQYYDIFKRQPSAEYLQAKQQQQLVKFRKIFIIYLFRIFLIVLFFIIFNFWKYLLQFL